MHLKGILGSCFFSLFASCPPGGEQVSSTMGFCHDLLPYYRSKSNRAKWPWTTPLRSRAQINHSSFKLSYFKYFVTVMEIQCKIQVSKSEIQIKWHRCHGENFSTSNANSIKSKLLGMNTRPCLAHPLKVICFLYSSCILCLHTLTTVSVPLCILFMGMMFFRLLWPVTCTSSAKPQLPPTCLSLPGYLSLFWTPIIPWAFPYCYTYYIVLNYLCLQVNHELLKGREQFLNKYWMNQWTSVMEKFQSFSLLIYL